MSTHATDTQVKPLNPKQVRMYLGSFWLFLLAESMIFVSLFSTRFLLASVSRPADLNYILGTFLTLLFLGSILPARQAVRNISQGNTQAMARNCLILVALGVVALAGILYDWSRLPASPGERFGESYLVTTGYHAAHILIGVLVFLALWASGRRGRFTSQNYWPVVAGVRFWYFVVAAWVGLYVVFFLI